MRAPQDRHQRLRTVFDEALLKEPSAREAYLNDVCADDVTLRSDVIRLLSAHQDAGSFLEHPVDWGSSANREEPFTGTERFRVVRRLGAGGMGVVYEVHDGLRDEAIALKTLRRTSAVDLYRLKQEFRNLAHVTHPNLVSLYELFVDDDRGFFTMELVRGVNFVDYARGADRTRLSVDRLVHAVRQLVDGVSAIHRSGKLHRDLKPSNILVTTDGRVVILDFGLMAEAIPHRPGDAGHVRGGTPAYMSPEEASGGMPSEASDWYGVGVTLYEALTGRVPFDGSVVDVLRRKCTSDPPAPLQVAPDDVPADLSAVCMGLLHRRSDTRLTGTAALRALKIASTPLLSASAAPAIQDPPFVGRHRELHALNEAHGLVSGGGAMTVAIYGASGIGKSALVRRFLSQFTRRDDAVVLAGRCYENESVPYKALDGVIDDLSRYLGSLPAERVHSLLPDDLSSLVRVFPVLLQIEAVTTRSRHHDVESVDPLRVRHRAFAALRTLLLRLAARGSLVIWIDDLQWADEDSRVLLEELLGPANPAAMLTLLCFRSEELAANPFLQAVLNRAGRDEWSALALEPMSEDEARTLVGDLLSSDSTLTDHDRNRMTREAGGSPFVLEQLALYASTAQHAMGQPPTFDRMFDSRLNALSVEARRFLEILAICGRPMAPEIVCDASGVARDRQSLVAMLRSSHFIRSSGSSARVEMYHDRIRDALADRIDSGEVRRTHGRLVEALIARRSDDCEALFEHHRGAGDLESASIQAGLAAEKATSALAFERAASFYRHALDLSSSSAAVPAWREGLATALANAGRPAEAAEAYLHAAAASGHTRQVELQQRAAEQFLIGGHIDRGLDLLRGALESVGLNFARTPRMALLRLLRRRAHLRWRGLRFVTRRAAEIDAETLLRLDTCWSAATGLALVDTVSASDFAAWHLQMALDAGEPSRIARGLALESSARNAERTFRRGAPRLAQLADALANKIGTQQAIGMTRLADSISATAAGEWKRALKSAEQTIAILRDQRVGVPWEFNIAQNVVIWALMYLGELGEVARRVPALLADARQRGDLYLATDLCTRSNYVWLVADDPDEGERETLAAIAQWSQKGFHRQHFSAMIARTQTALYRGDPNAAWRLVVEHETRLRRSMLTYVQVLRIESLYLRGRCALAMASANESAGRFLSEARACARRIARERMPWSNPMALLLQAGIASVEGRSTSAERLLEDAADQFDKADMKLYVAVSRRRLGELRGDDHGRELQRQGETFMAEQQIRNPARLTRMLAPGFADGI